MPQSTVRAPSGTGCLIGGLKMTLCSFKNILCFLERGRLSLGKNLNLKLTGLSLAFAYVCTSQQNFREKHFCLLLLGACGRLMFRNLLNVSCPEKLSDLLLGPYDIRFVGGPEHLPGTGTGKSLSRHSFLS